jgi:hypothetical protein
VTNYLLLNPDFFFFLRQRASAKGSTRASFWGGVYDPFFSNFFLTSEEFQWGVFSELKATTS